MKRDEALATYRRELLVWTEKINLIGPEAKANIDEHIAEAVYAAELLRPSGAALDFGSGGGLPGIPMAICSPDATFHLVEVDKRKWAFLKHAARECALNCQVHGDSLARVLTRLPTDLRFTLVVSRAVGNPEQWVPSLAPHLAVGARVALFQSGTAVPAMPGFSVVKAHTLPRGGDNYLVELAFHVEQA